MAEYDNNMRGVLFQNDKAKDTQPDYKGSCEIDGKEYWLSGWKKLSKDNKPFLSLAIQEKEFVTDTVPIVGTIENGNVSYDEPINLQDIPF
jgi:uncharacterized protein (DUF736 family)